MFANKATTKWAKLKGFAFFVVANLAALSANAQYTQVDQLTRQVSQLRGELQYLAKTLLNTQGEIVVMQKQSGYGSGANPSSLAALEIRVSSLETQLRNINGEIERFDFKLRQDSKDRVRFEKQLLSRMTELEEQVATVGVPNPERLLNPVKVPQNNNQTGEVGVALSDFPKAIEDTDQTLKNAFDPYATGENSNANLDQVTEFLTTDAQALYENALINLQSGQYDSSQKMFEAFLDNYSDTLLASNASYWLGETFYSRGDYTRAALQFSDGFTKYRDGNKSADHLLKLGLSLSRLNRSGEACASYKLLSRRFSDERPGLVARGESEAQQLNCAAP